MSSDTPTAHDRNVSRVYAPKILPADLFKAWALFALAMIVLVAIVQVGGPQGRLAARFLRDDLPIVGLVALGLGALRFAPSPSWTPGAFLLARPKVMVVALGLGVALVGAGGWFAICRCYPLSLDEFMATFDATTFGRGRLAAPIPPAWRPFALALQPSFTVVWPGATHWTSGYLPVNALLRAAFGALGAGFLEAPVLSAGAVVAAFGIARRLWPDRTDAAVVAALLMATSSQLLITAMTPYAMTAHLTLNLVWLWLFMNDRRWSDAAALGVGAAACGLHQVVFHPLFAAPFILQLWADRRWRRAAGFTLAYAAICAAWSDYWAVLLAPNGVVGPKPQPHPASLIAFARHALDLALMPHPHRLGMMGANMIRFLSWQNPLAIALAAFALAPAWRAGGVLRALAAGLGLTLLAVLVLMPVQGYGWGYRYLHGLLGSVCLIAALGWVRLTAPSPATFQGAWTREAAWSALLASSAMSLAIVLPWRAVQARSFIAPYAQAYAAMARTDADIVVVDADGLFYGGDMVRNDPFLSNRPKLVNMVALTPEQLKYLCRTHRMVVFNRHDAPDIQPDPADGQWSGVDKPTPAYRDPKMIAALRSTLYQVCRPPHVANFTRP